MKVCVTSTGNMIDSKMDPRFGRAAYFAFADTDTMEIDIAENTAAASGGGAGITSGQLMVDKGVKALITGNIGPNAMDVLEAANISIYRGESVSLKENIEKLKEGQLAKMEKTVPSQYGMGFKKGQK